VSVLRRFLSDPSAFDHTQRSSATSADRLHNRLVSTGGVEGATEIVGALRRPMVGMTKEGLGNADMRGIADRQLSRDNLSEQMGVKGSTEFALCYRT
jgi:hypothetical protein